MPRSDYWVKIFDSLPGHWKTRHVKEFMGWNQFEAVGFLVMFLLQVASDAPDGVLTELVGLRDILKAVGFKNKVQMDKITEALVTATWVEEYDEESGTCLIHDWEDGAGQLEKTRRNDKARQRNHRNRKKMEGEEDDGEPANSDHDCHADVTRESKRKSKKETPPNPPQAGGDFNDFLNIVLSAWREECERVPVKYVADARTKAGAAKFARQLHAGEIDADTMRQAMRGFLAMKYGGGAPAVAARTWNLNSIATSPSSYLPKGRTPAAPPTTKPKPTVDWRFRCDVCGFEATFTEPVESGRPGPAFCYKRKPDSTDPCGGTMHVVEGDGT